MSASHQQVRNAWQQQQQQQRSCQLRQPSSDPAALSGSGGHGVLLTLHGMLQQQSNSGASGHTLGLQLLLHAWHLNQVAAQASHTKQGWGRSLCQSHLITNLFYHRCCCGCCMTDAAL
jgi:hypothetical protein